jgi:hypothetical protein
MLDYSTADAARLVALDRLQQALADVEPDAEGYASVPLRLQRDFHLLAPVLRERGWAIVDLEGGVLRLRFTRAGTNELEVFRQRAHAAAARARGEPTEEWRP